MNNLDDVVEFEEITLPLMRVAVNKYVSVGELTRNHMRLDSWREGFAGDMGYMLSTHLIGNKVSSQTMDDIKYPSDWKESFKERWFPEFLKKRYPIRYTYKPTLINHYHLCPHADAPWNTGSHITFLTTSDEDYHSLERTKNVRK